MQSNNNNINIQEKLRSAFKFWHEKTTKNKIIKAAIIKQKENKNKIKGEKVEDKKEESKIKITNNKIKKKKKKFVDFDEYMKDYNKEIKNNEENKNEIKKEKVEDKKEENKIEEKKINNLAELLSKKKKITIKKVSKTHININNKINLNIGEINAMFDENHYNLKINNQSAKGLRSPISKAYTSIPDNSFSKLVDELYECWKNKNVKGLNSLFKDFYDVGWYNHIIGKYEANRYGIKESGVYYEKPEGKCSGKDIKAKDLTYDIKYPYNFGNFSICFEHYINYYDPNDKNTKEHPWDDVVAQTMQENFRLLWFVETNKNGGIVKEGKILTTKHYKGKFIYL